MADDLLDFKEDDLELDDLELLELEDLDEELEAFFIVNVLSLKSEAYVVLELLLYFTEIL